MTTEISGREGSASRSAPTASGSRVAPAKAGLRIGSYLRRRTIAPSARSGRVTRQLVVASYSAAASVAGEPGPRRAHSRSAAANDRRISSRPVSSRSSASSCRCRLASQLDLGAEVSGVGDRRGELTLVALRRLLQFLRRDPGDRLAEQRVPLPVAFQQLDSPERAAPVRAEPPLRVEDGGSGASPPSRRAPSSRSGNRPRPRRRAARSAACRQARRPRRRRPSTAVPPPRSTRPRRQPLQ